MVGKTIVFTLVFVILAGCAAKEPGKVTHKTFGDETLKLVRNGQYTLGCNDAKYMSGFFSADNYTVIATTTKLAMDYMATQNMPKADQKKIDEYARLLDVLTNKLEAKYKNDPKAMDMIMKRIFNISIDHVMEGAIAGYLGMASTRDYDEYIDITFCGAKPSARYKSPIGISKETLRKSLMQKFEKLPPEKNKPAPKDSKTKKGAATR